ncbi:MAG: LysM peptidoglycan-binding domain-containing protein, partial [Cyanobacteriota bacterium]|nr:LysM peptidoglycan-binding domain-containing protein [Cyanobacteriota bacterium]
MKRSLTPKVQPVSPCPADAFEVFATSPEPTLAMAKSIASESSRRVRPSTVLSLAAISMGATAGVLLPSPGDEAQAVGSKIYQLPLPSEATGNPYQALQSEEEEPTEMDAVEEEALATPQTLVLETAGRSVPTLTQKQKTVSEDARSLVDADRFKRSALSSPSVEARYNALSQSDLAPNAADTPLEKKRDKVVSTQFNASPDKSEAVNLTPIESDAPQRPLNIAPITPESSATVPSRPAANPAAPSQVAKTPGFVDSYSYNEPVIIPVPPPETATIPARPETALEIDRDGLAIAVPQPETAVARPVEEYPEANRELEAANAAEPELIVPSEAEASPEQTYQVRPGDTIDAIALRFGLSRSDLIKANNLANPHRIQIAQELRIPQPSSVRGSGAGYETVVPGFNVVPNEENREQLAREGELETAIANANRRESVIVPTQPRASAEVDSTTRSLKPASEPVAVSAPSTEEQEQPEDNTIVEASPNPYIERLKADIMRMREEYRAQRASETEEVEENVRVAEAPSTRSRNTEWQSDLEERSTPVETTANSLQVIVRDRRSEVSKGTQAVETQGELSTNSATQIAVAPVPPTEYNRNTRPQTGIQVSPELPPLAPDRYLPEKPAQFNGYIWPTTGVLTSGYGPRWGR